MKIHFNLKGDKKFERWLTRAEEDMPRELGVSLYKEAQPIFNQSQEWVPVDLGNLKNSGVVELPKYERGRVSVTIGYGNSAVTYAVEQHENLEYRHKAGQKAKYLEDAVTQYLPTLRRNLGLSVANVWRRR